VAITDGASLPPIGVRRLVVSDAVSPEEIASGPVVEHLLPGSSERYRAERRAIVDDFYRVVPA
jgi:hypothetical protein